MRYSLLICCFLLSACALSRPSNDKYVIKADVAQTHGPVVPGTVRIMEPTASAGLSTDTIPVMDKPNHLTHYNGVAWAKPLPQLFQEVLRESFQASGRFKSVTTDQEDISASTLLYTDISDFEVDNGDGSGAPSIRISLVIKLVDASSRKVIFSKPVKEEVVASANHMPQLIAAFNAATSAAAGNIISSVAKRASK